MHVCIAESFVVAILSGRVKKAALRLEMPQTFNLSAANTAQIVEAKKQSKLCGGVEIEIRIEDLK